MRLLARVHNNSAIVYTYIFITGYKFEYKLFSKKKYTQNITPSTYTFDGFPNLCFGFVRLTDSLQFLISSTKNSLIGPMTVRCTLRRFIYRWGCVNIFSFQSVDFFFSFQQSYVPLYFYFYFVKFICLYRCINNDKMQPQEHNQIYI